MLDIRLCLDMGNATHGAGVALTVKAACHGRLAVIRRTKFTGEGLQVRCQSVLGNEVEPRTEDIKARLGGRQEADGRGKSTDGAREEAPHRLGLTGRACCLGLQVEDAGLAEGMQAHEQPRLYLRLAAEPANKRFIVPRDPSCVPSCTPSCTPSWTYTPTSRERHVGGDTFLAPSLWALLVVGATSLGEQSSRHKQWDEVCILSILSSREPTLTASSNPW